MSLIKIQIIFFFQWSFWHLNSAYNNFSFIPSLSLAPSTCIYRHNKFQKINFSPNNKEIKHPRSSYICMLFVPFIMSLLLRNFYVKYIFIKMLWRMGLTNASFDSFLQLLDFLSCCYIAITNIGEWISRRIVNSLSFYRERERKKKKKMKFVNCYDTNSGIKTPLASLMQS